MPPTSAAYKRYLDKFDQQETEIEKIQKSIEEKQETVKTQQAAYDDYLAGLSVE
jgi:cytochrome c peroxidase